MNPDPQELSSRITAWANDNGHHLLTTYPPEPTNSSPISWLPSELLSLIFSFCLPDERYPNPSPTTAPLLPARVCSSWRRIAKSTPELWDSVHLNYQGSAEDMRLANLWMQRSGDRPLSLSLSVDFNERPCQGILNLACRHASRWKHVRLEFRNLSCPLIYDLANAMENVPLLTTFEFHARDVSTSNITPITRLLAGAPRLKELTWVDDLADTETLLALPLPRLARLSLSMNYGRLNYLELLDRCLNLEDIRIARPYPEFLPSQPPILLPKLTSLNLTHDLTGLLNHLVLPALKRVRVHLDADTPDQSNSRYSRLAQTHSHAGHQKSWDPKDLIELIERSACQVEVLWINTPMKDSDFVACLKACEPSLRKLTMRGGRVNYPVLVEMVTPRKAIRSSSEWECPFPRLVDLTVDTRVPTSHSLVEMVERRMGALVVEGGGVDSIPPVQQVSPFERLQLHYPAGHKDIPILREMSSLADSHRHRLDLKIVELRMGNMRGSSAGRTRSSYLYRRKVCSSR